MQKLAQRCTKKQKVKLMHSISTFNQRYKSDRVTYYDRLHFQCYFRLRNPSAGFTGIDSLNAKTRSEIKKFPTLSASEIFSSLSALQKYLNSKATCLYFLIAIFYAIALKSQKVKI